MPRGATRREFAVLNMENYWIATEERLLPEARSLGELLAQLRGRVSPVLIGDPEWERVVDRARGLPVTMAAFPFGFELPLHEPRPRADFGVSVVGGSRSASFFEEGGRSGDADPSTARIARLLHETAREESALRRVAGRKMLLEYDIDPAQVERVAVGTNHNMPNALIHHRPSDDLQAKFSMEFCIAIVLLERRGGLPEFTDEAVNRDDVKAMIEKIDFGVHPDAEAAGYHKMTTIIDIELKDGRRISGRADFGKGSPANPMSYAEVADKFRGCAEFARFDGDRTERIIGLVRKLERLESVRELTELLG